MSQVPMRLLLAAFVLLAALPASAVEQIGSIASSRDGGNPWTLDGTNMQETRAKLLNAANFGPGGTFPEALAITDVAGTLNATVLNNFDTFFVGYLDDELFSAAELNALRSWVNNGGSLIVTCDDTTVDQTCVFLGHPPTNVDASLFVPTTAGLEQTTFNGPFGIPRELDTSGNEGRFDDTFGTAVLATDASGGPRVLMQALGLGRIVYLGDIDTISDFTLTPGPAIDLANDNDRFLGNLFAFAAEQCGGPFLCLQSNDRFAVIVEWQTTTSSGVGTATRLTADSGYFWFFRGTNIELIVKVLDACSLNNRFWVFAGGLTNVEVEITVLDRQTGVLKPYANPPNTAFQPIQDTNAFATCP